jgi:hypothetical protein
VSSLAVCSLAVLLAADAAPPTFLQPSPQPVRRATAAGALIGAGGGAFTGVLFGMAVCSTQVDEHTLCQGADWLGLMGLGGLMFGAGGAVVGALIGATVERPEPVTERRQLASAPSRSSGEFASLSLHLGATHVLGNENVEVASPAARAAFMMKLGRYFELGPELVVMPFRRQLEIGYGGYEKDESGVGLAAAFRIGLPLSCVHPYAVGTLGWYSDLELVGSVGLGAEWRALPRLAIGAEGRLSRQIDGHPGAFGTLTGGLSLYW